jgi:nucleotide-binding universal stress UspA family protein
MTHNGEDLPIRRILVGVDASTNSIAAIEEAARLASHLRAQLIGVFVEDINLLHLAGLPFAREVTVSTGAPRQLDAPGMERQLRVLAGRARAAMAHAAQQRHVTYTFRVVRGRVAHEILEAARGADLLTLGLSSHPEGRTRGRLGSTAREAVARGEGPVLLLRKGASSVGPVVVAVDGGDGAERALTVGRALAAREDKGLSVVVLAGDPVEAARLREAVVVRLGASHVRAGVTVLVAPTLDDLGRAVGTAGGGLLVLCATCRLVDPDDISRLLDRLRCPVLVVR